MKADLHLHTEHSPCSKMKINELLKTASEKGLDVIAVTDHNTIRGGLEAARLNKNKKLKIIISCEKKCEYGELLIYNLKKEIKSNKFTEIVKEARKQDALIFISHPVDYLRFPNTWKNFSKEVVDLVDGFEVLNGRNVFNFLTRNLSAKHGKSFIAGSDAHTISEVGNTYVKFNKDLWKEVLNNKVKLHHSHSFFSKINSLTNGFFTKNFTKLQRLFSCQERN